MQVVVGAGGVGRCGFELVERGKHRVDRRPAGLDVAGRWPGHIAGVLREAGALVPHLQPEEERGQQRDEALALLGRAARREHPEDVVEHLEARVPVGRLLASERNPCSTADAR